MSKAVVDRGGREERRGDLGGKGEARKEWRPKEI